MHGRGGHNCGILRYYVYGVSVPSLLIDDTTLHIRIYKHPEFVNVKIRVSSKLSIKTKVIIHQGNCTYMPARTKYLKKKHLSIFLSREPTH